MALQISVTSPLPGSAEAKSECRKYITDRLDGFIERLQPEHQRIIEAARSSPHFPRLLDAVGSMSGRLGEDPAHLIFAQDAYDSYRFDIEGNLKAFVQNLKNRCGTEGAAHNGGDLYVGTLFNKSKFGELRLTPKGLNNMLLTRQDPTGRAYRALLNQIIESVSTVVHRQRADHQQLVDQQSEYRDQSKLEFRGIQSELMDKAGQEGRNLLPDSAHGVAAQLDADWQKQFLKVPQGVGIRKHIESAGIPMHKTTRTGKKVAFPGRVSDAYDVSGTEALQAGLNVTKQHVRRIAPGVLATGVDADGKVRGLKRKVQSAIGGGLTLNARLDLVKTAFTFDEDPTVHLQQALKQPRVLQPALTAAAPAQLALQAV